MVGVMLLLVGARAATVTSVAMVELEDFGGVTGATRLVMFATIVAYGMSSDGFTISGGAAS